MRAAFRKTMTRHTAPSLLAVAAAMAIAAPLPAMASVGGFRLPTPSPTPSREVIGPVAPDVPESRQTRRPQASPTPTPTPRASATTPAPTPTATTPPRRGEVAQPQPTRSQAPQPRATGIPSPLPQQVPDNRPAPTIETPGPQPTVGSDPFDFDEAPSSAPAGPAGEAGQSVAASEDSGGSNWLYYALGLLALLLAAGAFLWVRARGLPTAGPVTAPQIERPKPRKLAADAPAPSPAAAPAAAPAPAPVIAAASGPLGLAMTSRRISLSMMAATLDYELTLVNSGSETIRGIEVQGDLVSAHASLPADQQVAAAGRPLEKRHAIAELAPGENQVIKGQIRLPFSAIRAVAQGRAPLLVPLSRWRIVAQEPALEPLVQTFLVGQPSDRRQQGIQPFPLDKGPGVFAPLVQRSFA